jgi:5'-methylthioadenosine phosphorylase
MAHPTCQDLSNLIASAAHEIEEPIVNGGTYIAIEGPQFSTIAESNLYRSWSCDVIGMTNMPEARLAREAGICYSVVAMVTDFDCWHPDHDSVTVAQIVETFQGNVKRVQGLLSAITRKISSRSITTQRECNCADIPKHAVMTAPSHRIPGPFDALA